jgi:hypothetical protein
VSSPLLAGAISFAHNQVLHVRLSGLPRDFQRSIIEIIAEADRQRDYFIMIPCFSWRSVREKVPESILFLNERSIDTGLLPRILISLGLGVRTAHPTHSFLVIGNRDILKDFSDASSDEVITPFNPSFYLDLIKRFEINIALLNLGCEYTSFLHIAEEVAAPARYLYSAGFFWVESESGSFSRKEVFLHRPFRRDFSRFMSPLIPHKSFSAYGSDVDFIHVPALPVIQQFIQFLNGAGSCE